MEDILPTYLSHVPGFLKSRSDMIRKRRKMRIPDDLVADIRRKRV